MKLAWRELVADFKRATLDDWERELWRVCVLMAYWMVILGLLQRYR